jgi:hypothetical protein
METQKHGNQIARLLKNQKDYWKKRYIVRWTKLGDESTKFFHAAATKRYRFNTITSLDTKDGRMATDHIEKAAMIWEEFRKRLSCTIESQIQFNLDGLIQQHTLHHIDAPFTDEDVDKVVSKMPLDKAPDLDGFNGLFLRKCWHIIKQDIYILCRDFFMGNVSLQAINNSFITLVPKVNTSTNLNEFRPISLINCVVKIITKMLGERLQSVIIPMVHQNQYSFIKSRTIQHYLAWAFEFNHQCQQSKQEIVLIKLDFTKAFDTIQHNSIIAIMKQLGFSNQWLKWISNILPSASISVLLNGAHGKSLQCKRGVRQGDPHSPLLFVLAADLLQHIINKAHNQGLLHLPIQSSDNAGFPIIQYVDDTIIFLKASQKELLCLRALLESFTQSTSLRVNYAKTKMVPINLSPKKVEIMAGLC